MRGSRALTMRPKFELEKDAIGFRKLGGFNVLNTSHLSSNRLLSSNRICLNKPASRFAKPGPVRMLRPVLPNVPKAGNAKAVVVSKKWATLLAFGASL